LAAFPENQVNQTNNRAFSAYLDATRQAVFFRNTDARAGGSSPADRTLIAEAWRDEIRAFIDGAKGELPAAHSGRARFDTVKRIIDATVADVKRDEGHAIPAGITHRLDVAYDSLNQIPRIADPPAHHTLQWGSDVDWTYLFIHNNSVGLDMIDVNTLHAALFDDGQKQHLSAKCKNAPAAMIWYVHQYGGRNRLLAVTAANVGARTITAPRAGRVNAGDHQF
jgi:hypothetical protein